MGNEMWLIRVFTIFLATNIVLWPAQAEKLCLKAVVRGKAKKVRMRSLVAETCPRGFTELADSSSFQGAKGENGSQGPKGDTGAQGNKGDTGDTGPQGPRGEALSLYDNTTALIGPIIDIGCRWLNTAPVTAESRFDRATVLLTVDNTQYHLCASLSGFIHPSGVAYADPDCVGQAYLFPNSLPSSASTLVSAYAIGGTTGNSVLYEADYQSGSASYTRRSYTNTEGTCTNSETTETLIPAIEKLNLSASFSVPFSIE